jgi:hypothetical protein
VIQTGKNAPLTQETLVDIIEIEATSDQLDRHFLAKVATVARTAIYHSHAATADSFMHHKWAKART